MPRGQKYTAAQRCRFLHALKASGKVSIACKAAGMSLSGVYDLRARNDSFRKRWTEILNGRLLANIELAEEALFSRGVEGWLEPVFQNGREVGRKRKFSDTALLRYLAAKRPQEYGDHQRLEHSGEVVTRASLVILPALDEEEAEQKAENSGPRI